jgi:para-nitrobenzyl esterase
MVAGVWLLAAGVGACSSSASDGAADAEAADVAADAPTHNPVVETGVGPVRGLAEGGVRRFMGIPYAAPPTGGRRWKPPEPAAAWTEPRDATQPGPFCPQILDDRDTHGPIDEDCLTVNIWTADPPPVGAPVMVFLHGGSLVTGSGAEPTYDGAHFVAQGVVLVTLNYRLGILGFLAHPALSAEDPERPVSGNYGFLDQRLALQWVHDHIAAFGGDPTHVTLFGESAGALSTCIHALLPESNALFQRAILESNVCSLTYPALAVAEAQGESVAAGLGCGDPSTALSCLRDLPVDALVAVSDDTAGWGPVQDGVFISAPTLSLLPNLGGRAVMLGANGAEGELGALLHPPADAADYEARIRASWPSDPDAILAAYPVDAYDSPTEAWAAVITDATFTCPVYLAASASAQVGSPVYLYRFMQPVESPYYPESAPFHGAEVAFLFAGPTHPFIAGQAVQAPFEESHSPDEVALSDEMVRYWTRFAASGDPNGGEDPDWPPFAPSTTPYLELATPTQAKDNFWASHCALWSQVFLGQ